MQLKEHEGIVARKDSFVIDPRILKCELGYNVRDLNTPECKEHIAGLKESIAVNSVRVPLEVRLKGAEIYIVAGHCRWMAVMELIAEGHDEIKGVPCVQEPKSINDAERTLNLAISNSGKPLTTLEIAEVVKRLEGFGWTPEDIRRRMQWKSRATVTQHEEIAALSEGTKAHIKNGEISPTLARNIAKGVDPVKAEELIRANLEENKRIKGTGKRNVKVTKKTLSRDAKPKLQPPIPTSTEQIAEVLREQALGDPAPPIAASAPPEHLPPAPQLVMPEAQTVEGQTVDRIPLDRWMRVSNKQGPWPEMPAPECRKDGMTRELAADAGLPAEDAADQKWRDEHCCQSSHPPPSRRTPKEYHFLLEALEPFARIGQDFDLNEKSDDDLCEVRFGHIKKAWLAFAKVAGNE